jgi:NAD(P)-dependent dehydrogenase (short-subunit alcohol dehydrogenase family)
MRHRDLAWFGIRTMTLAPALFRTPMMERLPERAREVILRAAEFPVSRQGAMWLPSRD